MMVAADVLACAVQRSKPVPFRRFFQMPLSPSLGGLVTAGNHQSVGNTRVLRYLMKNIAVFPDFSRSGVCKWSGRGKKTGHFAFEPLSAETSRPLDNQK